MQYPPLPPPRFLLKNVKMVGVLQHFPCRRTGVKMIVVFKFETSFLFPNWFSSPVKKQLPRHLSSARMSNPHPWCPGSNPSEHELFQVKLINLFITWAVSLPNHRVRNESANHTASGAFVWGAQIFFFKLLCKCIFKWTCEAKKEWAHLNIPFKVQKCLTLALSQLQHKQIHFQMLYERGHLIEA